MPPFDPLAKQKRFRSMIAASTTAIHWDAFEKIIADPHKLAQLQQAFLDIANQPAPAPAPATASAFAPAANSAFAAPNSAFAPAATSAFAPAATSAFAPAAAPPPAAPTQAYPMDAQGHFYLRDSNISSQYFIGPHDFMEVTRTHDAPSCINLVARILKNERNQKYGRTIHRTITLDLGDGKQTDMLVHKSTKLYNQFAVGGKRNPWPRNTLVRLHDVDGEVRIDKTIVRYGESSKIKALPSNITWEQVKVWLALFDCQYVNDNATTTSSVATAWDNQGWGALFAALAALAVVGGYKSAIEAGDFGKLSGAWRILQGLPLAPAVIVLYFRLTLVESARFVQARYLQDHDDLATHASAAGLVLVHNAKGEEVAIQPTSVYTSTDTIKRATKRRKTSLTPSSLSSPLSSSGDSRYKLRRQIPSPRDLREAMRKAAAQSQGFAFRTIGVPRNDFWEYFGEWRHLRVLLGTSLSWFLVDITFYGINLNQSAIFALIGYTQGSAWHQIYKLALGNLIVVLAGFLPGYYLTVALVEVVGRKKIQLFGFAANAVLFLVLALTYTHIIHHAVPFFVVFVLLQLSFNAGSNATTFIVPAEVFPTRIRATAHGFCAAMGKLGSIVSSLGFSVLANDKRFGHTGIFWIFFGVSLLGLLVTLLLVPETKAYDADAVDRIELLERSRTA